MVKTEPWVEEAWENLLSIIWDNRSNGASTVGYTKVDLSPILSKYTTSGRGEIRIFNSNSSKIDALKKRGVVKIPLSRSSWIVTIAPPRIELIEPKNDGQFTAKNKITDGMLLGIKDTRTGKTNPGETTLLAIANYSGVIEDFYNLTEKGIAFTGGRQKAGIHLVVGADIFDMTKAQIEIDGGFEWPETVVVVEMKSSFKQNNFDVNQALLPFLKWEELLKDKKVYSLVLLAQTSKKGIEYWAYDFVRDTSISSIGMKINNSKKYILEIK